MARGKYIDLIGKRFGKLVVLEKTDKRCGTCIVWKCKCDCGNFSYPSTQNLKKGISKSCGCAKKEAGTEYIKDLTGLKFGKLTALYKTDERKDRSVVWLCRCDCGNEVKVTSHSLQKEKGGRKSCGCLIKEKSIKAGKNKILDLTGKKFSRLTVLYQDKSKKYKRIRWVCKCDCGNIKSVSSTSLVGGGVCSCGCLVSKGEEKITKILKRNHIKFETQKMFNDCRFPDTNRMAKFDFYINHGDCKYLIEFDGAQHYHTKGEDWDTEENFEKLKYRDEYKNRWCKKKGIKLIRIPYFKLKSLKLEDLLLESSKFIYK